MYFYTTNKEFEDDIDILNLRIDQLKTNHNNISDIINVTKEEINQIEINVKSIKEYLKEILNSKEYRYFLKDFIFKSLFNSIRLYNEERDNKLNYLLKEFKKLGILDGKIYISEKEKDWILHRFKLFKKKLIDI
jgi:hypothetical protein